jgi:hypothetical protein
MKYTHSLKMITVLFCVGRGTESKQRILPDVYEVEKSGNRPHWPVAHT